MRLDNSGGSGGSGGGGGGSASAVKNNEQLCLEILADYSH